MIIDVHVHASGFETAKQILEGMDRAGVDVICLFGPQPHSEWLPVSWDTRRCCDWLADIAREAPDRILPFGWIEPTVDDPVDELDRAVGDLGFAGVKMMPNHWYPTDEAVFPVYEKIEELGVSVIFHSGILFLNRDGSRFCRPVFYEVLLNFPKVRFALAHISWPWVDECLAVYGRFRAEAQSRGVPMQMWIDTTPGTPPLWRVEALQKTLAYADHERILWGSDEMGYQTGEVAGKVIAGDRRILHAQLGAGMEMETRWMSENAKQFLGL